MAGIPVDVETFSHVVAAVRSQTTQLLGITIGFTDAQWSQPTVLPGWRRSHIAAHVVDQAHRMGDAIDALAAGEAPPQSLFGAAARRAVSVGSLSSGVELQVQLDESSSELDAHWARLESHLNDPVTLTGGCTLPAGYLPLIRLHELVVHAYDLTGIPQAEVDPHIARQLLEVSVTRARNVVDLPGLVLISPDGWETHLGPENQEPRRIFGTTAELLVFLERGVREAPMRAKSL